MSNRILYENARKERWGEKTENIKQAKKKTLITRRIWRFWRWKEKDFEEEDTEQRREDMKWAQREESQLQENIKEESKEDTEDQKEDLAEDENLKDNFKEFMGVIKNGDDV